VPGLRIVTAAFVSMLLILSAADVRSTEISREQLQAMFAQMQQRSHWDLSKPLLWGYFFRSPTREPLEKAAPLLAAMGYRIIGVTPASGNAAPTREMYRLHVERIEVHSVDSLDARNHELYEFARANGIAIYDGMDVGPVSGGP